MNYLRALVTIVLTLCSVAVYAGSGNINLFLGQKSLDSSEWKSPYDEQGEFGLLFDFRGDTWPVSMAVDLLGSARTVDSSSGDKTVSTSELNFGVRKVFDLNEFHPYVGGGLASIQARYEEERSSGTWYTEDSGGGIWLNGGIYWTLGGAFNLGLDIRVSSAKVTLYDPGVSRYVTLDAGGTHAGLLLGYHW